MPSHPDRVRRSYHEAQVAVWDAPQTLEVHIAVVVSRVALASWVSARQAREMVFASIADHIDAEWKAKRRGR